LLALQLLTLLLEKPTDDSVEVAVDFMKEAGQVLTELTPRGTHAVFERFRAILHEGEIDKRVQYIIEGLFAVRKNGFADFPSVLPELDLVELDDQITHELSLDEDHQIQRDLDVFHFDPEWEENEKQYAEIKKEILGDDEAEEKEVNEDDEDDDNNGEAGGSGAGSKKAAPEDVGAIGGQDVTNETGGGLAINDQTDADIINLRRSIYLAIMSSVDFEECAHKLMKIVVKPGQESELCNMILECASQERTYMRFYGLLAERFCNIDKVYQDTFDECFANHVCYHTVTIPFLYMSP
jgi:pre-mRNA-splicing factor CWC22